MSVDGRLAGPQKGKDPMLIVPIITESGAVVQAKFIIIAFIWTCDWAQPPSSLILLSSYRVCSPGCACWWSPVGWWCRRTTTPHHPACPWWWAAEARRAAEEEVAARRDRTVVSRPVCLHSKLWIFVEIEKLFSYLNVVYIKLLNFFNNYLVISPCYFIWLDEQAKRVSGSVRPR